MQTAFKSQIVYYPDIISFTSITYLFFLSFLYSIPFDLLSSCKQINHAHASYALITSHALNFACLLFSPPQRAHLRHREPAIIRSGTENPPSDQAQRTHHQISTEREPTIRSGSLTRWASIDHCSLMKCLLTASVPSVRRCWKIPRRH